VYQGEKDKGAQGQINDSKKKNAEAHKQADGSVAKSKGVVVVFTGFGQDVKNGDVAGSDLDQLATQIRAAGYDVFLISGDDMGSAADFSEVSESTVQMVVDAVSEVTQGGSQGTEVMMIGFSRGAGAMVAVGNALASKGIDTAKMADIDGKLGNSGNVLKVPGVDLRVFRPEHWTPTQWLAPAMGLHGDIFMGDRKHLVGTSGMYNTTHGGMDQYGTGALEYINSWFFGSNP
jgi:hypothetical protein